MRGRGHRAGLIAGWLLAVACSRSPDQAITVATGRAFAEALVAGRYDEAEGMLQGELRGTWSAERLKAEYQRMTEGGGPWSVASPETFMGQWPDRKPKDHGWVYVPIDGNGYSEAVTVVVTDEGGTPRIRWLEWGRP